MTDPSVGGPGSAEEMATPVSELTSLAASTQVLVGAVHWALDVPGTNTGTGESVETRLSSLEQPPVVATPKKVAKVETEVKTRLARHRERGIRGPYPAAANFGAIGFEGRTGASQSGLMTNSDTKKEGSKVWFITGSSRGLGRALLDEVLAAGHRVVATARKPEDLDKVVRLAAGRLPPADRHQLLGRGAREAGRIRSTASKNSTPSSLRCSP